MRDIIKTYWNKLVKRYFPLSQSNHLHSVKQMKQLAEKLNLYRTQFSEIEVEAAELTEGLEEEQFNWKPQTDRWSIGQCIDHLNIAGYKLLPYLETAICEGREKGLTGEPPSGYGFLNRWFIQFNKPYSRFKLKTPKVYKPTIGPGFDIKKTVGRFNELQRELILKVEEANGLNIRAIKAPSPVNRLLRLSLGAWFEATVAHERRHLQQSREVIQEKNFPSALTVK